MGNLSVKSTAVKSTAVKSTAVKSTAVQSTAVQSTAVQSSGVQSSGVQSSSVQSARVTGRPPFEAVRRAPGFPGQLLRFACIGVVSTGAYLLLYLMFRYVGMAAQVANAFSLLLTAIANTAANRRITFQVRGTAHAAKHLVQGLIAFGVGLLLTSPALALLHMVSARPARITEVCVLAAANVAATAMRFILYRWWVFRPRPA
jgi:putative flippase GtrA